MTDLATVQLGVRRAPEMAAVFMIGDGLLGMLQLTRHVELWRSDVGAVNVLVRPFVEHPARRQADDLLQIGAGFVLASALSREKVVSTSRSASRSLKP